MTDLLRGVPCGTVCILDLKRAVDVPKDRNEVAKLVETVKAACEALDTPATDVVLWEPNPWHPYDPDQKGTALSSCNTLFVVGHGSETRPGVEVRGGGFMQPCDFAGKFPNVTNVILQVCGQCPNRSWHRSTTTRMSPT